MRRKVISECIVEISGEEFPKAVGRRLESDILPFLRHEKEPLKGFWMPA
jgi:hypothetical protein